VVYVDPQHFSGLGRALLRHAVNQRGAIVHGDVLASNAA
jgi:hypothetical protein